MEMIDRVCVAVHTENGIHPCEERTQQNRGTTVPGVRFRASG